MLVGLLVSLGMLVMYTDVPVVRGLGMLVFAPVCFVRSTRPALQALGVALGTFPGTLITHDFLWGTAVVGYLLLPFYLAAWPALVAWIVLRLGPGTWRAVVLAPFVFTGIEYVRGEFSLAGYPWYLAGHAAPPFLADLAHVAGTYAVSFAVACFGSLAVGLSAAGRFGSPRLRGRLPLAVLGFMFALVIAMRLVGPNPLPTGQRVLRVAAIQTSMSREDKDARQIEGLWLAHQRWLKLSEEAARAGAELIIWPETMYAGPALDPETVEADRRAGIYYPSRDASTPARIFTASFHDDLVQTQARIGVPMLIGATSMEGFRVDRVGDGLKIHHDRRFNSVFLVQDGRVTTPRYDKRRLMPCGEYIPLLRYFPDAVEWLRVRVAPGMPLDCSFGQNFVTFQVQGARSGGPVRVVTPVCFEAMYGSTVREMVWRDGRRDADLLVNPSNDNWFGGSVVGRRGHQQNAAWRCRELGLPMVRAVNTGLSSVINPRGEVVHERLEGQGPDANALTEGFMIYDVPIPDQGYSGTLYMRLGDLLPQACLGVTGLALALAIFRPGARRETLDGRRSAATA